MILMQIGILNINISSLAMFYFTNTFIITIWGNDLLYEVDKGHPFTHLMVILIPATFKPSLNLELYDESTDPQEHLEGF